ncbi:hypothetical protein R1sor_015403 [Riccia sorocarpa]|uniref:Pentatricopeptide repeat-containing protein n=1 Tax=Riccia sorocarpa TaxID=122646 RepID=A0ABD3HG19_9MARC
MRKFAAFRQSLQTRRAIQQNSQQQRRGPRQRDDHGECKHAVRTSDMVTLANSTSTGTDGTLKIADGVVNLLPLNLSIRWNSLFLSGRCRNTPVLIGGLGPNSGFVSRHEGIHHLRESQTEDFRAQKICDRIFDERLLNSDIRQVATENRGINRLHVSDGSTSEALEVEVEKLCNILGEGNWSHLKERSLELAKIRIRISHFMKVLERLKDPSLAFAFFEWAGHQPGFEHNSSSYTALIGILGKAQMFDHVEKLLEDMKGLKIPRTTIMLTTLVNVYGRAGNADKALDYLHQFQGPQNVHSYNALMRNLSKAGLPEKALLVYQRMLERECAPDAYSFGILIDAFGRAGNVHEACKIFDEMKKRMLQPNVVAYSSLINGLCKAGKVDRARQYFNEMKEKGCSPNTVTYNTLLDGLGKTGKTEQALQLFEEMVQAGLADDVSYRTSLGLYGTAGLIDKAHKVLRFMREAGSTPDARTYNILIGSLAKAGKIEEAQMIFRKMTGWSCPPNSATYIILIQTLVKAGVWTEAQRLFHEMRSHKLVADAFTYNIFIEARCRSGDVDGACEILREMLKVGCSPNVRTCNILLEAFCKANAKEKVRELFTHMRDWGCSPDLASYTIVLEGLCKWGRLDEALQLFADIRKSCAPSFSVYASLLHGLGEAGRADDAWIVFQDMQAVGHPPSEGTFNSLVCALCKGGKLDHALDCVKEMKRNGRSPGANAYNSLITGLCQGGRLEECRRMLEEMRDANCSPDRETYNIIIDSFVAAGEVDEAFKNRCAHPGADSHNFSLEDELILRSFRNERF